MFILYEIVEKHLTNGCKEFLYQFIDNFKIDNSERKQINKKPTKQICLIVKRSITLAFFNHSLKFLQPLNLLFLSLLKGL